MSDLIGAGTEEQAPTVGIIGVLSHAAIEELLRTALIGRIACAAPEVDGGRPFVVPLTFGYDGEAIYAHSGPGRKITTLRHNPRASFEVDHASAGDDWQSVICEVMFAELSGDDRDHALRVISPSPAPLPQLAADVIVYALRITQRSGRYERPDVGPHPHRVDSKALSPDRQDT